MNEEFQNFPSNPDQQDCLCKVIDCISKKGATGPTGPTG